MSLKIKLFFNVFFKYIATQKLFKLIQQKNHKIQELEHNLTSLIIYIMPRIKGRKNKTEDKKKCIKKRAKTKRA